MGQIGKEEVKDERTGTVEKWGEGKVRNGREGMNKRREEEERNRGLRGEERHTRGKSEKGEGRRI